MNRKKIQNQRNTRVFAVNDGNNPGFNILLDFSGQQEFLLYHKHNGLLYKLLKDGVMLEELNRYSPKGSCTNSMYLRGIQRRRITKLDNMVSHLLTKIDVYIEDRITNNKKTQEISNSEYKHKKSLLNETKTEISTERGAA